MSKIRLKYTHELSRDRFDSIVPGIQELLGQLNGATCTKEMIETVRDADDSCMLVAIDDEHHAVGMATLMYLPPSLSRSNRAFIDHVAVLPARRREGIAKELCELLLLHAASAGYNRVELTSRESNTGAHALYLGMGFVIRETKVFRHDIKAKT